MTKTIVRRRRNGNRPGPLWRLSFEPLEGRALMSLGGANPLLIQLLPGVEAAALPVDGVDVSLQTTDVPGLMRATGDAGALDRLSAALSGQEGVSYVEPERTVHIDGSPNDPYFANGSTVGAERPVRHQGPGRLGRHDRLDARDGRRHRHRHRLQPPRPLPEHLDQPGRDPRLPPREPRPTSTATACITFYDLNDPVNQGTGKITDINADGRIDAGDILAPMQKDSGGGDTGLGGWADGVSHGRRRRRTWTTSSAGTSSPTRTTRSTTTATARTSRARSRRWATTASASSA